MSMKIPTHCRLCDGACGLIAETNGDEIVSLAGNPNDPVSAGYICSTATQSIGAIRSPMRITQPMKRVAGELVPSTWDEAYKSI